MNPKSAEQMILLNLACCAMCRVSVRDTRVTRVYYQWPRLHQAKFVFSGWLTGRGMTWTRASAHNENEKRKQLSRIQTVFFLSMFFYLAASGAAPSSFLPYASFDRDMILYNAMRTGYVFGRLFRLHQNDVLQLIVCWVHLLHSPLLLPLSLPCF